MAKPAKNTYVCQSCGAVEMRWVGKCPSCGEWNTLVEETASPIAAVPGSGLAKASKGRRVSLETLQGESKEAPRFSTGFVELDRVTGGDAHMYDDGVPMHRVGQPQEVSAAVLWLLSGHSSYITGAILPVAMTVRVAQEVLGNRQIDDSSATGRSSRQRRSPRHLFLGRGGLGSGTATRGTVGID